MSEELIIRHCSPTLAGIKTASLFSCTYKNEVELTENIRTLNRRLSSKGLRIISLRRNNGRALIYVYRPGMLCSDMANQAASKLLKEFGYQPVYPGNCIAELASRLRECETFPHEIGLFLGYPPEDVRGFIENHAQNQKYTGVWKVYGDVEQAQQTFAKYKKCTDIYLSQWCNGKSVEKLTVSERQ